MKYWIFQNNQVLGPYATEDLSRLPSFSAESLVCPEGRKGTSMGDWQRAGMVPDLSVALIKASQTHSVKTPVASLAGLPPEPTLKDLAVLGSLQEKVAMLEDGVLQLQEGLRVKDAELARLHVELAGKTQESSEIKKDAEQLRRETEMRRRDAEMLKAETEDFKRQIAELQDRVTKVNALSETVDRAVTDEKHVEDDVKLQGEKLAGLTSEIEALRGQMRDRLASATASVASTAPDGLPKSGAALPDMAPPPTFGAKPPMPSFEATAPVPATDAPAGMIAFDPLVPQPVEAEPSPADAGAMDAVIAPPPTPSRKKALVMGGVLGIAALASLAYFSGKPPIPEPAKSKPAPDLSTPAPMPAPVETPAPAEPAPDERQAAIDFAKQWSLKSGITLGQSLETLSPSNGNLSPWMAEPLSSGRVQVNYFARGSAPGAPTVAYEFEVDLTAKSVSGRNAAAKSVIAGKAAAPPAPKKPKPVKVKAKPAVEATPPPEESLDSLLGEPGAAPQSAKPPESPAKPAKASRGKRAAKAANKAEKADGEKAEDASLLDDLLKE